MSRPEGARYQTQAEIALLELKSKLLTQLMETIRTSERQHDAQLISIIRNANSLEGLERDLHRFSRLSGGQGRSPTQNGNRDPRDRVKDENASSA